jgi:hypothetical protein
MLLLVLFVHIIRRHHPRTPPRIRSKVPSVYKINNLILYTRFPFHSKAPKSLFHIPSHLLHIKIHLLTNIYLLVSLIPIF